MLYLDLPRYWSESATIEPHHTVVRRAQTMRAQSYRRALGSLLRLLRLGGAA